MNARAEMQSSRVEKKTAEKGLHNLSDVRAGAAVRTAIETPLLLVATVCSGVDVKLSSTRTSDMPHSATAVARGDDTRTATNWKEGV